MDQVSVTLKVFFQDPFWVGVAERFDSGKLAVCKVTFGAEPKDYEVCRFFLEHYFQLKFSPAVEAAVKPMPSNPKRMQREAHRQVKEQGMGTKSQQALKLQQEKMKLWRAAAGKEQKEAEKLKKFQQKQQKKKEKHRGR
ncbi:MAG: YjdF family protein [Blautia sp.]|jgi:hypothetical protein